MTSWEDVAALTGVVGSLLTAIGFGAKSIRTAGRHEEQMKNIVRTVQDHGEVIAGHTAELAKGAGNFQTIDAKLDNIATSQADLKRGQEETQRLIIEHIKDGIRGKGR